MFRKGSRFFSSIWFTVALHLSVAAALQSETNPPPPAVHLVLDFFYEPGCSECERVEEEILPVLEIRYRGLYLLRKWDLSVSSNYLKLISLLDRYGTTRNAHVFMIVNERFVFAGVREISENLIPCLDGILLAENVESRDDNSAANTVADTTALLVSRVKNFTIPGVMIAGLVDGINPCAISTLIFLLSFLTIGRVQQRRVLVLGLIFCLATFLTYGAIGFGLLHALHALAWFPVLRKTVDLILVGILVVLAAYSFRDAFKFRHSQNASEVVLKLPESIRERIRRIAHRKLASGIEIPAVFALGVFVSALESVCTGQIYVPTLALVVRSGPSVLRAAFLLGLYNLMFVAPLIAVVGLMHQGLGVVTLLEWSKRNVFLGKLLLGGFFLALAATFLLLLR